MLDMYTQMRFSKKYTMLQYLEFTYFSYFFSYLQSGLFDTKDGNTKSLYIESAYVGSIYIEIWSTCIRNACIGINFVSSSYCVGYMYIKSTGIKSFYTWDTCLNGTCIGNINDVSAVKYLGIYL